MRSVRIARSTDFVFGFGIFNADGVCCYGTNTNLEELQPDEFSGDGEVTFEIDSLELVEGTYRAGPRRAQARWLPLRLPPPALLLPREVARRRTSASTGPITGGRFARTSASSATATGIDGLTLHGEPHPDARRGCGSSCEQRADGAVVFTNGVFDLLHPGHVRYLDGRAAHGDVLIVGINADRIGAAAGRRDRTARSIPSTSAPRCSRRCACVDAVVIFDEDTPHEIVSRRCSPTSWSRAPTGPRTPSSAATWSKRAAGRWCGSRSRRLLDHGHRRAPARPLSAGAACCTRETHQKFRRRTRARRCESRDPCRTACPRRPRSPSSRCC